jgi:glutamate synthase domain-containing protein 2/glutamate synthase domain-containing protein 1/glutamate synthase domain-containing protein 3
VSLESVSGKSLPSRDVSNCALHAVCYPLPTAGLEALDIQKRMGHRTGSLGAGIAVGRWNHALLEQKMGAAGRRVDPQRNYYALTLWRQNSDITLAMIEERLRDNGYHTHLIEDVPTNPSALGRSGLTSMPIGFHRLVITDSRADHSQSRKEQIPGEEERLLNMMSKMQKELFPNREVALPSWTRVFDDGEGLGGGIEIFKGVGNIEEIWKFYEELASLRSNIWMTHGRYPTLSQDSWSGAHPFNAGGRITAVHNGNIITADLHRAELQRQGYPLWAQTDSEVIPTMLDSLIKRGLSIDQAILTMTLPEAERDHRLSWEDRQKLQQLRSSYPDMLLDGPAAVIATDGYDLYAFTGRKGLRPIYPVRTPKDNGVHLVSEPSSIPNGELVYKNESGKVRPDEWIELFPAAGNGRGSHVIVKFHKKIDALAGIPKMTRDGTIPSYTVVQWDKTKVEGQVLENKTGFPRKIAHSLVDIGFTDDHIRQIVNEGQSGKVEITAMGANRRLAFWTLTTKVLDYLKVGACQIADPPVNSEVEPIDTSIYLGRHDISKTHEPHTSLALQVPFLISTRSVPNDWINVRETLQKAAEQTGTAILDSTGIAERSVDKVLKVGYIPTHIASNEKACVENVNRIIKTICENVQEQVESGKEVIVLSDTSAENGHLSVISAPLVANVVDHYLKSQGLRSHTSLIVESLEISSAGDALKAIALGADGVAVDPRVMLLSMGIGEYGENDPLTVDKKAIAEKRTSNLIHSWNEQIKKLMGGADLTDIRNATGNPYLIYAIGLGPLQQQLGLQGDAIGLRSVHDFIRPVTRPFHDEEMVRVPLLIKHQDKETATSVRLHEHGETQQPLPQSDYFDCLRWLECDATPIDRSKVDLTTTLVPGRPSALPFELGGASFGSVGRGLHEVLSSVLPENGIFYQTGEGGRPTRRAEATLSDGADSEAFGGFLNYMSPDAWTSFQVASGRFGVRLEVLNHSGELQIKMGQGAKPGLGGHLPGEKVTRTIAEVRGIPEKSAAISPATHNDITSIEDFRLLVSWLKEATGRNVPVSVKLAAVPGIEVIALGCARAGVDKIVIDGFRGATGAAPKQQQSEVGLPVAVAIALIDDALEAAEMRDKVRLVGGGGLRSVDEMMKLIALGADGVLITSNLFEAISCNQCMQCHKGECRLKLAAKVDSDFDTLDTSEASEHLQEYLDYLKDEMTSRLAKLGLHSPQELRGRRDLLGLSSNPKVIHALAPSVIFDRYSDYSYLLSPLLQRKFISSRTENIKKQFGIGVQQTNKEQPSLLHSNFEQEENAYRVTAGLNELVRLAFIPGVTSEQKAAIARLLEQSVKELEGGGIVRRQIQGLTKKALSILEQSQDGNLQTEELLSQFRQSSTGVNNLTSKLAYDPLWGSSEAYALQHQEGAGRELGDVLENALKCADGSPIFIDWSHRPLQGDRFMGVDAARRYVKYLEKTQQSLKPAFTVYITLAGSSGDYFGSLLPEGMTLHLMKKGAGITHTQNNTGECLNGGRIIIEGNVGDSAGYAMRQGSLFIKESAGSLAGCNMRGKSGFKDSALIVIGGNVGDRAFEQMSGGTGIVIRHGIDANEEIGQGLASGMFGGQIYMRATEQSVRNAIDCSNRKFIKIEPVISLSEGLRQTLNTWSDEFGVDMKDLWDGWLRVTSTRQGGEHYTE